MKFLKSLLFYKLLWIWMIYQSKTLMLHTTRMMRNLVCLVPHKSRNKEMGRKNTPFGSHPLHGKASSFKNPMKESLRKMSWLDQEFSSRIVVAKGWRGRVEHIMVISVIPFSGHIANLGQTYFLRLIWA